MGRATPQTDQGPVPGGDFEAAFIAQTPRAHRQKHGQFFTPDPIAQVMADWIAGGQPASVLDPAVGPGRLLAAVQALCPGARLRGVDIDATALALARDRLPDARLDCADFLTCQGAAPTDAIIANPPYLRRRDIPYAPDIYAQFSQHYGLTLSRLSNIYALFLAKGLAQLAPGGRAAFLVPLDWANANFGAGLKAHFARTRSLRHVIYHAHAGKVFDDNLSSGCVLLFENTPSDAPVMTHYVPADCAVSSLADLIAAPGIKRAAYAPDLLARTAKWDHLIAHGQQADLPGLVPLRALASTRRGIATGANAFFHVPADALATHDIPAAHWHPCVAKARDVSGYRFTAQDFARLQQAGRACALLDMQDPLTKGEAAYIAQGAADGLPDRHLTKSRTPWFRMERQTVAPIWAAVFGRAGMRFIVNEAGARTLTAFHCIYPTRSDPTFVRAMAACLNSDLLQARARIHHRVYAGGLLKMEPRDLLAIELPDLTALRAETLADLAGAFGALADTGSCPAGLDDLVHAAAAEAATKFM